MILFVKVVKSASEFVKFLRFGKSDVGTAQQARPHGIDSLPPEGATGVYVKSSNSADPALLGYVGGTSGVEAGETRIYATDATGAEKFSILLKKDGTVEIGGNSDNLVGYGGLDAGLQTLVTDLNAKLATAFSAVGGTWPGTSVDVSGAKKEDIKTG